MLIEVRLDPDAIRQWQRHLVAEIAALPGLALRVVPVPGRIVWPRGMETLLALEDLIGGRPTGRAGERADFTTLLPLGMAQGPADLVLDLVHSPAEADEPPSLEILCDGLPFEAGAIAAVLAGRAATFETRLREGEAAMVLSRWRPAVETPHRAGAALDMLFGRAAEMLYRDVARLRQGRPPALEPRSQSARAPGSPATFFAGSLEARIRDRLTRLLGRAPDWYVALRPRSGGAKMPQLGPEGFRRLPDDGARFYADPFLYEAGGRSLLFVEEFPYATRKGILSVAEIRPDGGATTPRPILEGPDHLSYPFVFAAQGAIWMTPETSARRTVELYRADPFPDRWTLHQVLIEGADLSDATLLRSDGAWWIFAASRARWTSSWDALSLYRSESLFGPWRPHPANPVLVDLTAARPGGRVLAIGDRLVRPVQDCAGGYGAGLTFAEIERLDEAGFAQRIVAAVKPWGGNSGLHSYDRTDAFEAIDLFGPR